MKKIWQWFMVGHSEKAKDLSAHVGAFKFIRSYQRWRRWGLVSLVFAIFMLLGQISVGPKDHIAVLEIRGEIKDQSSYRELLENIQKSKTVKALFLKVNSGGGSAAESEWIYNRIKMIKQDKKIPVVALVEGVAASGALMAILPSDHVVAYNTSVIGSVGALINVPDVSNLMKTIGVTMTDISSGALKGQPNVFSQMDKQAFTMLQRHVLSIAAWFLELVKTERGLTPEQVDLLRSGRIFVASEALSLKLIDVIGHEQNAKAWLNTRLQKELPMVPYKASDNKPILKDLFRKVSQTSDGQSPLALKWSY